MPLGILVPLVICGIASVAVLLHLLGLSQPASLADEHAARAAWRDEFPDTPATRVVLSHDHSAALVQTRKGPGLVWPMGADTTARFLTDATITQTATGLRIDLPDYTAPHIDLRLDPDEARRWPAWMEQSL